MPIRPLPAALLLATALVATGCSVSPITTGGAPAGSAPSAGAEAEGVGNSETESAPAATLDDATVAVIEGLVADGIAEFGLRSVLLQVNVDGRPALVRAWGESLPGVPATTDMRFRNGAMAFTYIGQTFARMVDEGLVSLDDPLSTWRPDLPAADRVTLRDLLTMTSGYVDYVYQPEVLEGSQADPLRQYADEELIDIGVSQPLLYEPGTNWSYSHTNYVILGTVLQRITGQPLDEVLQDYVLDPMELRDTGDNAGTPAIPEPVLHAYSSERRDFLGLPADSDLYEESTFWNPSWTTANGAVQTTTIDDMTRSMEIVGSGAQVSPQMYEAQTGPALVGFGTPDPTGRCTACATLTDERHYGMGVVLRGPWITQTKLFAGSGATTGYLPSERVAISIVTTYAPEAFDNERYGQDTPTLFAEIADVMAPGTAPGV